MVNLASITALPTQGGAGPQRSLRGFINSLLKVDAQPMALLVIYPSSLHFTDYFCLVGK
jgi:hypothetical protein